jgi:hypothetical protein
LLSDRGGQNPLALADFGNVVIKRLQFAPAVLSRADIQSSPRRIGGDYQPKPAAVESVFWSCGIIQPVPGLFVAPTGNSVALGDSDTLGRA